MLADRGQLARVCGVLTRGCAPEERLWSAGGPSQRACALLEQPPAGMTGAQRVLLELAFCLWEGGRGPSVGQLLGLLDGAHLHMVGGLFVALSDDVGAVDRWVRQHGGPAGDA